METLLYIMGYILVVLYILFGFDDFIWDIITLFRKRGYKKNHIELSELESSPPKMLAVMIGAWHESNVIKNVVENLIASTNYPISMYHVFVGVYPNDSATIRQVEILEKEFSNVHMVINDKKGPTSKAQNLNYVIRQIKKYESANHISFASFTIHDSEDVIHPYELLMTNYMIDKHDAIQFPVFPIISMPKFKNFFKNITTCTYADEFAENHFSTLVGRYVTGAFVPSAGTGFALSRKTILSFGDEDVLPANSQTEDYKLSLILYEKGIQMHYILEKIPRVTHNFKIKYDYITTRSLFPNTYKSAIKQKTRWIYGITMQSARLRDVLFNNNLSVAGRYSLYKDLKAKYGNLIIFFGYIIMIYWIASFFMNLPPVYVKGTVPYYLCFIVTGMMILRQFYRAIAITNVYGFRSMFFACLFPPLFPIRLIYGNIINFVSTVKAYEQKYFFEETKKRKEKNKDKDKREGEYKKTRVIKWAHTDHEFLDFEILKRYHRNLGDTLLMKGYVDPDTLLDSLTSALELHQRIGTYLLNKKIINETQLMDALATTQHRVFIDNNTIKKIIHSKLINKKDIKFYEDNHVVPLLRREDTIIFGITNDTVEDIKDILSKYYGVNVYTVYITKTALNNALNHVYENDKFDYVTKIYKDNRISSEQYVLILKYSILGKIKDEELINKLGIQ
jgi:adsorption protein B